MTNERQNREPDEPKRDPDDLEPSPTEEIASSAMPDEDGFVRGSAKDEVKSTTSLGMNLWLYSPAKVQLLTEPTRALAEVAQMRGLPNRKIEAVEAFLHVETRTIYIRPAAEEVDDPYPVAYRSEGSVAEINLRSLLQPSGLEVTRGWREKYAVRVEPKTKFGPALVFQMTPKPPRERVSPRKSAKAKADSGAQPKRNRKAKQTASGENMPMAERQGTDGEIKAPVSNPPKDAGDAKQKGSGEQRSQA